MTSSNGVVVTSAIMCDGHAGRWTAESDDDDVDDSPRRVVRLDNKHIVAGTNDILFHFGLSTASHDLRRMFSDVKFVCIGGSSSRMKAVAELMSTTLHHTVPAGQALVNIATTDRFAMYKVGPVLTVSHGIGISSMSVMLHELIKLLHHANVSRDVCIFRLGTSGGIGVKPGTVVVSKDTVDSLFRPYIELPVLDKLVRRPAILDKALVNELMSCHSPEQDDFDVIAATTMCALDFYEGQGRLDGAFCEYSAADKLSFLRKAYNHGARNIEMESVGFAAFCHRANVRGAVLCVTMLNRFEDDQVQASHEVQRSWQQRPSVVVSRLITQRLRVNHAA